VVLVKSKHIFKLDSADCHVVVAVLSDSTIKDNSVKLAAISSCLVLLRLKEDSAAVAVLDVDNQCVELANRSLLTPGLKSCSLVLASHSLNKAADCFAVCVCVFINSLKNLVNVVFVNAVHYCYANKVQNVVKAT